MPTKTKVTLGAMPTSAWACRVSRLTTLFHTIAIANCCWPSFAGAQPPSPPIDDQTERRSAPLQTDREPGYLGLVTDDRREQGQGVRVVKVVENSPAAKAGFAVDDLIVAIGGQPTGSLDEMGAQLQPRGAGEKIRFEVRRGGGTQTLEVELGRRPARDERPFEFGRIPERLPEPPGPIPPAGDAAKPLPNERPLMPDIASTPRSQLLGIRTAPVTEAVRLRLGIPDIAGARVVSRVVGSPADKAGIPLEAVIVAVDEQPVASPADLARLISAAGAGNAVELTYLAGGQQRSVRVTLAGDAGQVDATPPGEPRGLPGPFDRQFAPAPSAAERIELLERRIRELELRVQELERALGAANSAAQERD
jgi:membrane-associated protease RseP (regulator of RpoE activity)